MQSDYSCVVFHVKHKTLPFLAVLTWFLILGKVQGGGQDGDHRLEILQHIKNSCLFGVYFWQFTQVLLTLTETLSLTTNAQRTKVVRKIWCVRASFWKRWSNHPQIAGSFWPNQERIELYPLLAKSNLVIYLFFPHTPSYNTLELNANKARLHQPLPSCLACENSRHLATLPLVSPPNDVCDTSAEIPYWWRVTTQIWLVLLIGRAE